jgi:hypothetical protein
MMTCAANKRSDESVVIPFILVRPHKNGTYDFLRGYGTYSTGGLYIFYTGCLSGVSIGGYELFGGGPICG